MTRRTSIARVARRPPVPAQPVPGLSRERVCREALALVDEEGLAALSMRRLGARLGVEAMSLYRHVRDKDDLLDAIHAAVLGDLPQPPASNAGHWRALLGGMAGALRSALLRHRNALPLFGTRTVRAPEATAAIGRLRSALVTAGFDERTADQALKVIGVYTIGYALSDGHHGLSGPRIDAFEFGLDAILDGLAAHVHVHVHAHGRPLAAGRPRPRRRSDG